MKNTILLLNGLWLLGLVACQPKSSSLSECPIVNVRSALQEETPISMKEDVVSIQYIPLETTDSCLISNLLNLQVTTDYMFMYNGKTEEVLQFDQSGKVGCSSHLSISALLLLQVASNASKLRLSRSPISKPELMPLG
jgi:hypothetical protein